MFSATSAMTAGRNNGSTDQANVGVWNSGSPIQGAAAMAEVSTLPRNNASTQPAATARKIASRPIMPRNTASTATSSTSVTNAMSGSASKLVLAVGARLNPISATTAPVTTGGSTTSSQWVPATCTTAPMRISDSPTATMPPSAPPGPALPIAPSTGASTEKLEPR